jgi:hypothetical protein
VAILERNAPKIFPVKKAFISYSTHDKFVATEVAKAVEVLGLETFLAHDDISISESWRERILKELKACDLFVPLLSNDFKQSDWCSMECGYIMARPEVTVLALSLDGTWPFGFLAAIQGSFLDIAQDLGHQRLISRIRGGLYAVHFDFAFATLIESVDCAATTRSLRGYLQEVIAISSRLNSAQAHQIVCVLEKRTKICRSEPRMRIVLESLHTKLHPLLDDDFSERLKTIYAPIQRKGTTYS